MRAAVELLVVLALVGLAATVIAAAAARARAAREAGTRWRVDTHTRNDGTLVVSLRRGREAERVVRELPPGMDPIELASELQLAREDAELAVQELNRSG
jgi:hypothetical protein